MSAEKNLADLSVQDTANGACPPSTRRDAEAIKALSCSNLLSLPPYATSIRLGSDLRVDLFTRDLFRLRMATAAGGSPGPDRSDDTIPLEANTTQMMR